MGKLFKGGCGCLLIFVGLVVAGAFLSREIAIHPKLKAIKYLAIEFDRSGDCMELYSVTDGQQAIAEFREVCTSKRRTSKNDEYATTYVLFDTESNASFPTNPFSAGFGVDTQKWSHIRAIYESNPRNGFSQFTIFDANGKPSRQSL